MSHGIIRNDNMAYENISIEKSQNENIMITIQ